MQAFRFRTTPSTKNGAMQETWRYGGSDELFPGLTWANRPSMAGSEASEDLQRAWVAVIMAIQDVLGAVKNGNCFLVNVTAGPRKHVLGEPVFPAPAMPHLWSEPAGEYGMRWRPDKWVDGSMPTGEHMSPCPGSCWHWSS